ncbi:MAG: uracil-DNA glycosylase, partial [Candidatus Levybacteria bacterium CG10_big_fil_rev_8_21_14_0_10_36_7]
NDRPPENRDPTLREIKLYSGFLDRQIDLIQPKIIATLGRFSMVYIMEKFGVEGKYSVGEAHGKEFIVKTDYGKLTIVPLYHPAVALYNVSNKKSLLKDFKVLKKYI